MLDAVSSRRRTTLVSAAIRIGYAWTVRRDEPRAWREIMSMTGVVNSLLGPGRVALTPTELVDQLSRDPLRQIAPEVFEGDPLGWLTVLEWGELSDDVYSDGCSAIISLLEKGDRGRGWMPSWTWLQQEIVQNEAFLKIKTDASDADYVARRRFVIEYPAGELETIADQCSEAGIQPPVHYAPLPPDRVHEGRYWWPCPTCRWPMRVSGTTVRCSYRAHNAEYAIRSLEDGRPPKLRPRDDTVGRQPAARLLRTEGDRRTVCVDLPAWRYIVVPGVDELALYKKWHGKPLLDVSLWPHQDAYDLKFTIESLNWTLAVDLKDVASASVLADEIARKPLAAKTIVLPDHRGIAQRQELQDLLPDYTVLRVEDVNRIVKKKLSEARRAL
ncbi:hypothetical protein [Streptomyces sp. NBC_00102]|uniref:restriction endonuclease-related protein n=1 Tax=Streptomyces sp. NBC_00102 TaxID=2975652 RepID=UPI00225011FB|nr:hypothetical protein [Streptomyces sp. NBC_00102]MCX5397178.1 hypothetical protein [Streptomyces sp. NBC_00102]